MKRPADIVVSLAIIVLLWPLILLLAALIRLETPGNPLFGQRRLGRNEKPFTIWKLRTMRKGTPHRGTHEITVDAYTRFGGFLRRTKLDELPQAFNILAGHMSLVGPRPCLPSQDELIAARRRLDVFSVRPGVTGLAQIRGIDMSRPQELAAVDREYIDSQSMALDLRICMKTVAAVFGR
ncbi:sugar transferase [Hoeflea prorocentri]|uniref:Sugar transferase n=1 Tax=Hoeflea prorocentri TaxID=1922333 RepID=A0A9X3ZG57_9HYPH|nr:sugar transferase [Hoeflea prorocentri]MCY6379844.1 sugar transferase [Hoeflea prorocentri]MDA5397644.1 sugar transferase [Hoeflea prorocentri]